MEQQSYVATTFVSCSLRQEDRPFVDYVLEIIKRHRINPIGTVGMFSASPNSVTAHMKENIPKADIVVIVATPRLTPRLLKI